MHPLSTIFLDTAARHLDRSMARIEIQARDRLLSEGWLNHELYLAVRENQPGLFCSREPFYTCDFEQTVDRSDLATGAFQGCRMDIYLWDEAGTELFVEAKLLTHAGVKKTKKASLDADYTRLTRGCNSRRQGLQVLFLHSLDQPLEEQHRWIQKRGAWARRSPDFEHRLALGGNETNTFRMLAWAV